jgi:DNA-binding transcriptional LysR family regulator
LEIHQIRYFLALSRSLNFTRAAEECNVSQPALTRAVQALEAELGGPLILRERRTSHLTELGKRMLPLLQRCYESAENAKELARAATNPQATPIRLGVSHTVNLEGLMGPISAMLGAFPKSKLTVTRGGGAELLGALKAGEVDLVVAGPLERDWERLDDWQLWEDCFVAVIALENPHADGDAIAPKTLGQAALVVQAQCESRTELEAWLSMQGVRPNVHEVVTQTDVAAFVEAGLGFGLQPNSGAVTNHMRTATIEGLDLRRAVSAYGVAGRVRPAPANALLTLLRARANGARTVL